MTRPRKTRFLLTAVVTLAICWLTLVPQPMPMPDDVPWPEGTDKAVHMAMFMGWTLAALRDTRGSLGGGRLSWRGVAVVAVAGCLLGGVVELLQEWLVAGRDGSWADWGADVAGVLAAIVLTRMRK